MFTANLGDSRAVVASSNDKETCALEISIDHKPTRDIEQERVKRAGGKIERSTMGDREVGPYRVWKAEEDVPGIAITRSLGDLIAHKIGVIAEPEVTTKDVEEDDKFVVMGSDGVWDVMSSAEAVGFILQLPADQQDQSARKLVEECRERWDLLNEIKRKQAQIAYEQSDTSKKTQKHEEIDHNIVVDDITVVVHYLI